LKNACWKAWNKGLSKATDERVAKYAKTMSRVRKGRTPSNVFSGLGDGFFFNTKPEKEMKRCLDELGVRYEFQYSVWCIKHRYVADFYLPLYNVILEVDGKEVHNYPDGLEMDNIRTQELEQVGYRVLRFWEGEFNSQSVWREI
jgi:very-short-patch-repair endonuclease